MRPQPRELKLLAALTLVVMAATMATHWPALSARAISFDDHQYLLENPLMKTPSWKSVRRFFSEVLKPSTVAGYYQPLSMTSLMLDVAMSGGPQNFEPFHRTSLILHCLNAGLVVILMFQLFRRTWPAAASGLLFGLHPLTIEPIPWIGERKTLLATFFALGALIAYARFVRSRAETPKGLGIRDQGLSGTGGKAYVASIGLFVLALLSKPTIVPLPLVMLLMDVWPLGRFRLWTALEKIPHLIIGGVFAYITVVSQGQASVATMPTEYPASRIPLVLCHNIVFYLRKIFWPSNLSSHYPYPNPLDFTQLPIVIGVVGTILLAVLLVLSWRKTRAPAVGWLIFFVAILPTMQIIGFSDVIASDKYAYFPAVGILMIVTWLLTRVAERQWGMARQAAVLVVVALCIGETFATRNHLAHWQATAGYYEYMLGLTPDSAALQNNLAVSLASMKRYDEAIVHYRRALELKPGDEMTYTNLGVALARAGKRDDAIKLYQQALEKLPRCYSLHTNLGALLAESGRNDEAIEHYRIARLLKPENAEVLTNYANGLLTLGKKEEAVAAYREALELRPDIADIHNNLAAALESLNKPEEAAQHYEMAIRLDPNHAGAHRNFAVRLANMGLYEEAARQAADAVRLSPQEVETLFVYAQLVNHIGRRQEAIDALNKVLTLDSGFRPAEDLLKSILNPGSQPSEMPTLPGS